MTGGGGYALQDAYELRRVVWREQVQDWLATRELPGSPEPIEAEARFSHILSPREAA